MVHDRPDPNNAQEFGQVLRFRLRHRADPPGSGAANGPEDADTNSVDDLAQYEQDNDVVDYRQRMLMNVIAVVIVTALVGVGVWIADTIADMQKVQDCAMQGRQNCAPIEVEKKSTN